MQTTLIITDMECPTCSHFLETKLGGLPGVKKISTNLKKRILKINFDETQLTLERIIALVSHFGYHPIISETKAKSVD